MVNKDNYEPGTDTAIILDRGYELVQSVPYQVSTRWVFYQLLQEGYYSTKEDYKNKWVKSSSRARHAFYKGWRPDTLIDETREIIYRSQGHENGAAWLKALSERLACKLDKWPGQEYYFQLWFEARAMIEQFRYYTEHVDLVPMGGQPSVEYKYRVAKELESSAEVYRLPMIVLYFGDLDTGGKNIAKAAENDVRKWCAYDFEFIHCGLTIEQVTRYSVPENYKKPGAYQWEALSDTAAAAIITDAMKQYVRHDAFSKIVELEDIATMKLRRELKELAARWSDSA